jgi:hypothetical protein
MPAPTYDLKPTRSHHVAYLDAVRQLADQVLARGQRIGGLADQYGAFIEETGRETRRSPSEYLLEALMLGVLWRARGAQSAACVGARATLMNLLVRERRAGGPRRRDGSNALLLSGSVPEPGRVDPSLEDIERLMDWLTAHGEYDDEVTRLEGWVDFLRSQSASAKSRLRAIVGFAVDFEARSLSVLGAFTDGVHRFLRQELGRRPMREDTVQCSRQRIEYHANMVGQKSSTVPGALTSSDVRAMSWFCPAAPGVAPALCAALLRPRPSFDARTAPWGARPRPRRGSRPKLEPTR